jgi:hypothetical protein
MRGCQLSVVCKRNAKAIFKYLADNGVIGDWREPDVISLSPVPLYNTFQDVYNTANTPGKCIECRKIISNMVYYNPKEWFSFIFKIDKADTLRELLPLMLL